MFVLNSDISIAQYKRVKPVDVRITKSIFDYVDKAIIRLPITARIVRAGKVITDSVETAKQFNEGDPVTIMLGYNNVLNNEFSGFISRVNFTSPLEVEAEGYSYQLRKQTYTKTFVKAELLDILKFLVTGTDIKLDEQQIPAFVIEKLKLSGHSGIEALEKIKECSHQTIHIFFTGNLLYAGLLGLNYKTLNEFPQKPNVTYRLGWNVIKDNSLKLRQAKNSNVIVKVVGEKKDGTKETVVVNGKKQTQDHVESTTVTAGISGETHVIKSHAVIDKASLEKIAEAKKLKITYDGYEGIITTFLQPYCEPAFRADLQDQKYVERSGKYLVQSVETIYGTGGARRRVGIGLKL
jgi:hypothetical protein